MGESLQSIQSFSKGPQTSQLHCSPSQRNVNAEELTESNAGRQNPDKNENTSQKREEKAEDATQELGETCLKTLYRYCAQCQDHHLSQLPSLSFGAFGVVTIDNLQTATLLILRFANLVWYWTSMPDVLPDATPPQFIRGVGTDG